MILTHLTKEALRNMLFLTCFAIVLVLFGRWVDYDNKKQLKRMQDYVQLHDCIRTGFAGRTAIPVYECDTGIWTINEVERMARGETLIWQPNPKH